MHYFNLNKDTDSLLFCLTEPTFDDIVKPGMKSSWLKIKTKWFADETPAQQKEPGLLKEEFSTTTGLFVGLRYSYHI